MSADEARLNADASISTSTGNGSSINTKLDTGSTSSSMRDQPPSPTVLEQDTQLQLQADSLYIVLTFQSTNRAAWHWALYLHIDETLGWVFHITNLGRGGWEYHCCECRDMTSSPSAISVVKIAEMAPDMHDALRRRIGLDRRPAAPLRDTCSFGAINCRTWLLQLLQELDNEGYISVRLGYSIGDIEQEAWALASRNKRLMTEKGVNLWQLRREIESAFCVM